MHDDLTKRLATPQRRQDAFVGQRSGPNGVAVDLYACGHQTTRHFIGMFCSGNHHRISLSHRQRDSGHPRLQRNRVSASCSVVALPRFQRLRQGTAGQGAQLFSLSKSKGSPIKRPDQVKKFPCTGPFFVFRISCFHPSSFILSPAHARPLQLPASLCGLCVSVVQSDTARLSALPGRTLFYRVRLAQ